MSSTEEGKGKEEPHTNHMVQTGGRKETDPLLASSETISTRVTRAGFRKIATAVGLWIGYVIVSAAFSLLGPFFPEEAAAKGASPTMVGIIVSSSPLCVVIFAPIFGYLLPRLGTRFTLLAGLWLVGGSYILLAFMDSPQIDSEWMFIVFCVLLRMTEGIGSAMSLTAIFALLPEMFPNHVGTVMGLFEVAAGLGFSVGPPLGGLLYNIGGFRLPFLVLGGATLLSLPPYFFLIKGFECEARPLSWKILKTVFTNFMIVLLSIVNILSIASLSFLTPTFGPFLTKYFLLDPLHVGLVFLAAPFSYMVCALIVGPLSDKLGPRCFILLGQLVYSVSIVFIGPADFIGSPQLWVTITACVVLGIGAAFGMIPIYADILQIAKRVAPDDVDSEALTGVLSGVVESTISLGEFLGPIVSGGLTQYLDFQTSGLLFAELGIAVGFLLLGATVMDKVLTPKDHKPSATTHA